MPDIGTWQAEVGAADWRTLSHDSVRLEKPIDLVRHQASGHRVEQRSYSIYLAVALLLFAVLAVYGMAQLLTSMGQLGRAL